MQRHLMHAALGLLVWSSAGCTSALEGAAASEFFARRDLILLTLHVPTELEPNEEGQRVQCTELRSDDQERAGLELDVDELRERRQPANPTSGRLKFRLTVDDLRQDRRSGEAREPISVEVLDIQIPELELVYRRTLNMTFDGERDRLMTFVSLVGFSGEVDELAAAHELGGEGARVARYTVNIQARGLTEDGSLVLSNEVSVPLQVCTSCDELQISPMCLP